MIFFDPERPSGLACLTGFDRRFACNGAAPAAIFDFDGVLCSAVEDQAYKLPELPGERARLFEIAPKYNIDPTIYDLPYLRHLLLQASLEEARVLPEVGPLISLAREMSINKRTFFVLTARSGRSAINRALAFLDQQELTPQEIFFVGRVSKGRQIAYVRRTLDWSRGLVFFDDGKRHAKNSHRQSLACVATVRVDVPASTASAARALTREFLGIGGAEGAVKYAA